ADGLGLGLLDIVAKVVRGLGAVAGADDHAPGIVHVADGGLEDGERVVDPHRLGGNLPVRVLRAEPDDAPLDFKILGRPAFAAEALEVLARVERGRAHAAPPLSCASASTAR